MNPTHSPHQIILLIQSLRSLPQKIKTLKSLFPIPLSQLNTPQIQYIFHSLNHSLLKRELVSLIGRTQNPKFKNFLLNSLQNSDPKIVIQAIRALKCFKEPHILSSIQKLQNHPNEMIKKYLQYLQYPPSKPKNTPIPSKTPRQIQNLAVNGNTLPILKQINDESIHLTFTSPPYYNAKDYSIYTSYEQYLNFLFQTFQEIYRITCEGRFFVINTSPIIIPRPSRQSSSQRYPIPFDIHPLILKAGFEFVDDIIWVKPETSVKNRNGGFQQHRKPLAYKPNPVTEYVMVYRKKTHRLIDWNIKQYQPHTVQKSLVNPPYESSNLWQINPVSHPDHPATFPPKLCENIISFYSYAGDIVFDPFAGTGTVGQIALRLQRYFFLTEINPHYFKIIQKRLHDLFSNPLQFMSYQNFVKYHEHSKTNHCLI